MTLVRTTEGPRRPRAFRFACLAAAAALLTARCTAGDAPATLSHTFDSPEALARTVLTAVAERDTETLLELSVSGAEFRKVVWPELPSSRPEVNLSVDYAWGDLNTKSRSYLASTLSEFGGRRLELVAIDFTGESTSYRTFSVHRHSVLTVRADGQAATERVRLFGSVLERDGRFKLFSYVVD